MTIFFVCFFKLNYEYLKIDLNLPSIFLYHDCICFLLLKFCVMKKLLTLAVLLSAVVLLAGCTAKPAVEEVTETTEPTVEAEVTTEEVAPEVAPEAMPEVAPEAVPAAEATAE